MSDHSGGVALVTILTALAVVGPARAGDDLRQTEITAKGYVRICADPANRPFTSEASGTPGFELERATSL